MIPNDIDMQAPVISLYSAFIDAPRPVAGGEGQSRMTYRVGN